MRARTWLVVVAIVVGILLQEVGGGVVMAADTLRSDERHLALDRIAVDITPGAATATLDGVSQPIDPATFVSTGGRVVVRLPDGRTVRCPLRARDRTVQTGHVVDTTPHESLSVLWRDAMWAVVCTVATGIAPPTQGVPGTVHVGHTTYRYTRKD